MQSRWQWLFFWYCFIFLRLDIKWTLRVNKKLNKNVIRTVGHTSQEMLVRKTNKYLTPPISLDQRVGHKPALCQVESASQLPLKVVGGHRQGERWWGWDAIFSLQRQSCLRPTSSANRLSASSTFALCLCNVFTRSRSCGGREGLLCAAFGNAMVRFDQWLI